MDVRPALSALRREYWQQALDRNSVLADPVSQFQVWFDQAVRAEVADVNAMGLATADAAGRPSVRMVLLKQFDRDGFVFFTNYDGRKAAELAANPWAALVFWWVALERQVRIEGRVAKTSPAESDDYFASRPWGSQISAWASSQSEVVPDRIYLERQWAALEQRYEEDSVPRPPFWGGYRLQPTAVEFWQGRPNRLHDRLRYRRRDDGNWLIERLAP